MKTNEIINKVVQELGEHSNYFNIKVEEVLVDEKELLSTLVSIIPKQDICEGMEYGYKIVSNENLIEIQLDEFGDFSIISGEDTEITLNVGNLYCKMYWGIALVEQELSTESSKTGYWS